MTNDIHPTTIVFDCGDAQKLASFWAAVAGGTVAAEASADDATVERPGSVDLSFIRVPEGKTAKNRVHVDITVAGLPDAVARAAELGAVVVSAYDGWTTLRDPEGNEFDLVAS
jgi:Glyoxalase-like domain